MFKFKNGCRHLSNRSSSPLDLLAGSGASSQRSIRGQQACPYFELVPREDSKMEHAEQALSKVEKELYWGLNDSDVFALLFSESTELLLAGFWSLVDFQVLGETLFLFIV